MDNSTSLIAAKRTFWLKLVMKDAHSSENKEVEGLSSKCHLEEDPSNFLSHGGTPVGINKCGMKRHKHQEICVALLKI